MVNRFESRMNSDTHWVFLKMANVHTLTKEDIQKIIREMKKYDPRH